MFKFPVLKVPLLLKKSINSLFIASILFSIFSPATSVSASASLSIIPITWNVVGLDSNNVTVGPNRFPVAGRVCNTGDTDATNVTSQFEWLESTNQQYIYTRPGTLDSYSNGITLAPGACHDFYYEIEIARNTASYRKTRDYRITASADGGLNVSTPTPREIFVEKLVSQNRNEIINIYQDGVLIPVGGTLTLVVGNTYNIRLEGKTSTAYNQLESFINIDNTIFRINTVSSTYSTVSMAPPSSDLLYADSCGWDNDPNSSTYMSCIVSDGKSGGTVNVIYNLTILSGAGTNQQLSSMFYDYSGSSFHYNADFSRTIRNVTVVSPLGLTKSFAPSSITAGSTTRLIVNFTNTATTAVNDVDLTDLLPSSPAQLLVAASPALSYSAGCTPESDITIAPDRSSFTFSGGVNASSTCSVGLDVSVPLFPMTGVYTNVTNNVFVNDVDTGVFATANLNVIEQKNGTEICSTNTLVSWRMTTTVPSEITNPPGYTTKDTNVVTASVRPWYVNAANQLTTSINTSIGNPASSWELSNFKNTSTNANLATDPFIEFTIDATKFTNVHFSFDASRSGSPAGPRDAQLYASTDGTNYTLVKSYTGIATTFTTYPDNISGGIPRSTTGNTIYRLYGLNPQNTGVGPNLFIDNMIFTGDICTTPQPPTMSKGFVPATIPQGGTSRLTFNLSNPNSTNLTQVNFSDILPFGVVVNSPANTANTCGGSLTASASTISLTGGVIPPAGCSIGVDVTGDTAGVYLNVSGAISAHESGTNTGASGTASATLQIADPLGFSKSFSPNPIYANQISTLTFIISNPNPFTLNGINLIDNLYSDLVNGNLFIANPSGAVSNGCGIGSVLTAEPDSGSIQLAGGSIPGGGICTINVRVTSSDTFDFPNTASLTTAVIGLVMDDATDTLAVIDHYPGINVLKQVSNSANGPWSGFLYTGPASDVYYRLRVENVGDVALTNLVVNDPGINTSTCRWPSTLPVASAAQDPTATCIVGPITAATEGIINNTVTASGDYDGSTYQATSSATYAITDLVINKTSPTASFDNPGDIIQYEYEITNNGDVSLNAPLILWDSRISTFNCPPLIKLDPDSSVTCTGSYIVSQSDVRAGSVTNAAYAIIDGTKSNTDRLTVYSNDPDLVTSKLNDSGSFGLQGAPFNWIIKSSNVGPVAATFEEGQIILRDELPSGANYSLVTPFPYTNISGEGTLVCEITGLILECTADAGEVIIGGSTGSFTLTITVSPLSGGISMNTVVVDPNNVINESNESNNTASDNITISSNVPSIALDKTASPSSYFSAGTVITYTYQISNTGSSNINGPFSVTDDKATVTCPPAPVGGLAPLASLNCTAEYIITQADMDGGSVTNTATASADGVTSNEDSFTITANQTPLINVVKSSTTSSITTAGQIIPYNFSVTNPGNITLSGITISDSLCSSDPVYQSGDTDLDNLLDLDETWLYSCSYTVTQLNMDTGGVLENTVTVDSTESAPDTDTYNISIGQEQGLSLDKSSTTTSYDAIDQNIDYSYLLSNSGNVTLNSPYSVTDNKVTVTCPDNPSILSPGDTVTCSASYTTVQDDINTGYLTNEAVASAFFGGQPVYSDTELLTIYADQDAVIQVQKSSTTTSISSSGQIVPYTFTITNTGNVSLSGITVDDPMCDSSPQYSSGDTNDDDILDLTEAWLFTCDHTVSLEEINSGGNLSNTVTADSVCQHPKISTICKWNNQEF